MTDRNFAPPTILNKNPLIVGGIDLHRSGTWLGVNKNNIIINILNKWKKNTPFSGSDSYQSRGILVLELLKEKSLNNIISKINNLSSNDYLPFYMIVSDIKQVYFIEFDEKIKIIDISNQNFIAGNLEPASDWNKFKTARSFLNSSKVKEIFSIRKTLKQLLKYQKGNFDIPSSDFSVNLGSFQTTSSTILEVNENNINYFFANGKPINTDYQDYSYLLKEM
jgi:uncharacterized protein with NRDE domain